MTEASPAQVWGIPSPGVLLLMAAKTEKRKLDGRDESFYYLCIMYVHIMCVSLSYSMSHLVSIYILFFK